MPKEQEPKADSPFWISATNQLPENGREVWTKIDDANGARNISRLRRSDRLWFTPEQTNSMYVYYTPTHWLP